MNLQQVKRNYVIDVAKDLFLSRSISLVTIKDIASKAGVGEMTIYRYFQKKQTIVIEVAMSIQKEIVSYFDLSKGNNGLEKLSIFFNAFLKIFEDSPRLYQFINEFDSYMLSLNIEESLNGYEESLMPFKNLFVEAYKQGLEDGSTKEIKDIDLYYYTSTHSLIELCKKLSTGNGLLKQDQLLSKHKEISMLIDVLLNYVKHS